jgi:protocatechuate 3,4-dioxygenase beta subunit
MLRKSIIISFSLALFAIVISACASSIEAPDVEDALPTKDKSDQMVIEVTYFTPPQQEGPYYPVEKLADRDNDLLVVSDSPDRPEGEVLSLAGVVYDSTGHALEGAVIEIWQTDNNVAYMHPADPKTEIRDLNFQFYGESVTGSDGVYSFRTLLPGLYGNRPRHIHVKVRLDGDVLLTTQFYFANEIILEGDDANLLVLIAPTEDDEGKPIWIGERDIILDIER